MVAHPDSVATSSQVERELARILGFLNPPQQKYDVLADEAWGHLDTTFFPNPSVERDLALYFARFSQGYVIWQDSYNYPKIHEYFYAAYLQATKESTSVLAPELKDMLNHLTKAVIAATHCENALISNNPKGLLDAARQAGRGYRVALGRLNQSTLNSLLGEPIESFLRMNIEHSRGLELCAEMYLAPEHISTDQLGEVMAILESLGHKSRELTSELRAHFVCTQRLAQVYSQRSTDLQVKNATLWIRATGYLNEEQVARVFEDLKHTGDDKLNAICRQTGMHIESIWHRNLMDIFETVLGETYLDQVVFYLSSDTSPLTFTIRDGIKEIAYTVDACQVYIARIGSVSVEFEIPLQDASVSHMRVLESLIAPHAGEFEFIWHSPQRDLFTDISHESTDYVDCFLSARKWIMSISQALVGKEAHTLTKMAQALAEWERVLDNLAESFPHEFKESGDEEKVSPQQSCFQRLHELAQQWIQEAEALGEDSLQTLIQRGKEIFPPGYRFSHFMDIAEEIFDHLKRYFLPANASGEAQDTSTFFDSSTGWQTIVLCDNLVEIAHPGKQVEPVSMWDYRRLTGHKEFKGLVIQNREARSAIDDWLFVATPDYQNLAKIRSHEHDVMCMGENRAFLYLPDDPQFLTMQYVETVRLIDNIRNILFWFNHRAKEQINDLERFLTEKQLDGKKTSIKQSQKDHEASLAAQEPIKNLLKEKDSEDKKGLKAKKFDGKISDKQLKKDHEEILSYHNQIEIFRTQADKILDLLRACTVSRYQDHGDLLNAMIRESRLNATRDSLEHNISTLEHFHAYLSGLIDQHLADRAEKGQNLTNGILFALAVLGGLAAIPALPTLPSSIEAIYASFVDSAGPLGGIIQENSGLALVVGILVLLVLLLGLAGLRNRLRKKNS